MWLLFFAQIGLFSLFPLYFTFQTGHLRRVNFYIYLSLILFIGGYLGNIYSLPLTDSIHVSAGNLCYGAFMMTAVLLVWLEKDVTLLRQIIRLVVFIDLFNVITSTLITAMLSSEAIVNVHNTPVEIFSISVPFIVLGGVLIISELFVLLLCFDVIKRFRLPSFVSLGLYIVLFVAVLCLDGVLFPLIAFGFTPEIIAIVIGGLSGKFVTALSYASVLVFFAVFRRKAFLTYLTSGTASWRRLFLSSAHLQRRLVEKEKSLQQADYIFQNSIEGLAIIDKNGELIKANPAFYSQVSLSSQTKNINEVFYHHGEQVCFKSLITYWRGEVEIHRGSQKFGLLAIQVEQTIEGLTERLVLSLVNIQNLKEAHQKLDHLAKHDPLTGLANRRVLDREIAQLSGLPATLIAIDIDRFKTINDSFGHNGGDIVLQCVASRLLSLCQQPEYRHSVLCRVGGDEFTVLLTSGDEQHALSFANQVQRLFEKVVMIDNSTQVYVSATLGLSVQQDGEYRNLVQEADAGLYAAKRNVRGSLGRYEESLSRQSARKLLITTRLKKALDQQALSIVFQPQYSLFEKRFVGVEALVRWTDSELGNISPAEFIPIAEESGLIRRLGDWVLYESCCVMKQWQQQGLKAIKLSVNVSSLQLQVGNFAEQVAAVLTMSGLPAEALQLELTESAVLEGEHSVLSKLNEIKRSGVSLAIDDFGTGYSSLSYIANFPWDSLKIDKSFIDGLPVDEEKIKMVKTIVQLAKNMNLIIVVEGVESKAQVDFLNTLGCDVIQGYYFAKPLDGEQAFTLIMDKNASD